MTKHFEHSTIDAARGKWRGILAELGVPVEALTGRHTACPLCGGKDRFRWDNKDGNGSYICGQCGAGTGMQLAMRITGEEFGRCASLIDPMLGNVTADAPRSAQIDERRRVDLLRKMYANSQPIERGGVADCYFQSRGLHNASYPKSLRFVPRLPDGDGGTHPAIIALIGVYGAPRYCSMHRTFLKPDGSDKAEIAAPRKLAPGPVDPGACVALSEYTGGPLGIAEGIETAMAATALFEVPVWAAISARILEKWSPPDGCNHVIIFGDNDPLFGGQSSAFHVAHRLAVKGVKIEIKIPDEAGQDWNDVWLKNSNRAAS